MSILLSMFALILMVSLLWVILAGLFWSMRLTEKNFQFALNASLAICRRLDAVIPFRSTTNHHFDCTKMTHPQQTTREVIEQLVDALNHCMDAITERGLNGSPDQAEKWGLQLPLARAESAITAARSVLANPTPSTTGEADEYQYRTKPTWDANAPWSDWTKCNRGSFEDYKRTPVHNDWIYEARALFAATPPQVEPAPSPEVLQALTDPENQPNQFGVVFGMHGPRMFFAIGNQSFDLAYEPDEPEEFEFMKRMLCSAFYTFTPDVKTVPAPSTAGERAQVVEDLLMYAGDNGYSHIDYADTMRHAAALLQSTALPERDPSKPP